MTEQKHLWEVEHPYYCNEGNYYAPGNDQPNAEYKTFSAFLAGEGDADMDMNLLFRFDWSEDDGMAFNGDPYYRNGKLLLFWMGQRKGLYRWTEIEVCRADEPAVIEFLRPRLAHLLRLWEPLTPTPEAPNAED
ncbi:hypothetical protein [Xanthobacter tagetidis]|uniref:Uncharacterized protein n=1 Tax=Xanthobacter tagetidis TaxID=60216 RepID=A0A3L7AIQ7_9HYPH|nr:hypothetical protein [Xanthobacter tagetidis]MBB6306284.1 hypothetical protein [Xanthobacter tagetidis]RLP79558.1 hypothetical protein D9R14_07800 [Xanthobacter tagetidis]